MEFLQQKYLESFQQFAIFTAIFMWIFLHVKYLDFLYQKYFIEVHGEMMNIS